MVARACRRVLFCFFVVRARELVSRREADPSRALLETCLYIHFPMLLGESSARSFMRVSRSLSLRFHHLRVIVSVRIMRRYESAQQMVLEPVRSSGRSGPAHWNAPVVE